MAPVNNALWIESKQSALMEVSPAPYPKIGNNELIISTTAVAINPADWILQRTGLLLTTYPAIIGCDAAGIVQEVGSELSSRYKPGDRVFGAAGPLDETFGDAGSAHQYRGSAFQEYVVLKAPYIAKIPSGVAEKDAVVLPLGLNTAASCLFGRETLALALPPGKPNGKVVIVWGASSSVGACGVQLARAAGYDVIAVAGRSNFDMVRGLGAVECFDHKEDDVVSRMVQALRGLEVAGGLDAISSEDTISQMCEILSDCGKKVRKLLIGVKPGAEKFAGQGVEVRTNFVVDHVAFKATAGKQIWEDFLPAALNAGTFLYKPDAEVVGHGLENVQRAVDQLADVGVSARKLVVTV